MLDQPHITMQRAKGRGHLRFDHVDGRDRLQDLHQSGCLKLMIPRNHAPVPDAVMINTAGGLTGDDHLEMSVELGAGASLRLATQTAERIYQSTGEAAHVALNFELGAGAQFDWLAQETILFNGGAVQRRLTVDMADDASLLLVEPIVLGRHAMGEVVETGLIHDQWRVRRGGELIFADAMRMQDFDALQAPAALGDSRAVASVLFVDPSAEAMRDRILALPQDTALKIGASAWNDQLLIRVLSNDGMALRKSLKEIVKTLRGRDLPRVWTM